MYTSTAEIMSRGMSCLRDHMGVIDAERFISAVIREKFDYTAWQRTYFDELKEGQFHTEALAYAEKNPYDGKAELL